jgi:Sec-independent protein translocase protein TatA
VTASELVLVVAAVLCCLGFTALVVVLMRVLDALRDVRRELDDLRAETTPLILELQDTTEEARATVDEARADLERFDRVLGSAEAISDAVGGTVTRTSFSTPMIKAAGLARGTSRTIARLRGTPRSPAIGPMTAPRSVPIAARNVDAIEAAPTTRSTGRNRRRRT